MRVGRHNSRWLGALCALFVLVVVSPSSPWAQRSVGEVIDDALITTKVKASLAADPLVSALAINVDTAEGVVTLTGVVSGAPERQRAIQLAQSTEGVKRVQAQNLRLSQ